MSPIWFEIVRCRGRRYSWVLVTVVRNRRIVAARSTLDYGSKTKVRNALLFLAERIGDAEVIDATSDAELPDTSFVYGPAATPLLVGTTTRGRNETGFFPATPRKRRKVRDSAEVEVIEVEVEQAEEPAQATAETPRAATTRTRRR